MLRGGGKQWNAERNGSVADQQARCEIVGPVDDQVVAVEHGGGVARRHTLGNRIDRNERIARGDEGGGKVGFARADIDAGVERLALQIGQVDGVTVDDRQMSDPGAGECGNHRCADATGADHCDLGRFQTLLASAADLGKHDVAGVAVEFLVGHRPVLPKPPAPRSVSESSSTSSNSATVHTASIICAMRSPRRMAKDSVP